VASIRCDQAANAPEASRTAKAQVASSSIAAEYR
jgi:hypothetical protein